MAPPSPRCCEARSAKYCVAYEIQSFRVQRRNAAAAGNWRSRRRLARGGRPRKPSGPKEQDVAIDAARVAGGCRAGTTTKNELGDHELAVVLASRARIRTEAGVRAVGLAVHCHTCPYHCASLLQPELDGRKRTRPHCGLGRLRPRERQVPIPLRRVACSLPIGRRRPGSVRGSLGPATLTGTSSRFVPAPGIARDRDE